MAQMSEDGKWYWDGHNWHPVPQVQTPTPPEPEFAEPEEDEHPGRVSVRPDDTQVEGRDVDFGTGLLVDNAALRTVNTGRDTAYSLATMFALLVAFVPGVFADITVMRRSGRDLDATMWLETAFLSVLDIAREQPLAVALTVVVTLAALAALRGLIVVRLFSASWLQALAAAVVGYAAWQFGAPYLP